MKVMDKTTTKQLLILCTMLFGFQMAITQNLFWEEDFSTTMGLPTGWTTEDASGGEGAWTWCSDSTQVATCIPNWNLYASQHENRYFSGSVDNGFVLMDSDILGEIFPDHIVRLTTSAIDCSGQPEVWMKFESLIGVYGLPTTDNALLRASTNGTDWTNFNVFEISISDRWSDNPEYSTIDISSVAVGESTVYLQFSWTGNYEYYWLLDDLQLYDADPSALFIAAHDLRVNENFYAIAPNLMTPASQVECFSFLADIENTGSMDQTNVNLNISIDEDGGGNEYSEDLTYGTIAVDSLAENVPFSGCFTPSAVPGASYTGTYIVSADSVDLVPENNIQAFDIMVTDTVFAKEDGATTSIRPADSNWGDTDAHSWAFVNYFYIVNGEDWWASSATFSIGEPDLDVIGRIITLYLYKWDESATPVLDNNMDPEERTRIGYANYVITGDEDENTLINLPFTNMDDTPGPLDLEDTTSYVLMIEYVATDQVNFFIAGSGDVSYSAMSLRSEEVAGIADEGARYGEMLGIAEDLESEPYSSAGFTSGIVPVVRLNLGGPPVSTKETLDAANIIGITPNPANSQINLSVDLVKTQASVNVRILDVNGRLMLNQHFDGIKKQTLPFDVSDYSPGAYFLHFITENGVRTQRFIVQH